jgi:hypothetical protein
MKNSLIRGFVVALAIAGFTASSVAASHSTPRTSKIGSAPQTTGSVPLCSTTDPTHCGMD